MNLRKRLGMLQGIHGAEMPYRDPHTAGPGLWALRHSTGTAFEVAVLPVEGTKQWRLGQEAVAMTLYRLQTGASPTLNFGRMPQGYRMSSANNARLMSLGRVFRGGPTEGGTLIPSLAPLGPISGDPCELGWCGHTWSTWLPVAAALPVIPVGAEGLYRIRDSQRPNLLYIGQGSIGPRLGAHLRCRTVTGHAKGRIFANAAALQCSWVVNLTWTEQQRLELENDLIAAHILETGLVPDAQFLMA